MTLWYQRLLKWLNFEYFKTLDFTFKVTILFLSISGAIAAAWNPFTTSLWQTQFYHFVSVSLIVLYTILILLNYLNVIQKVEQIPWTFIELILGAVYIIAFIIVSSLILSIGQYGSRSYFIAAGIIGFAATICLIIDGVIRFIYWRRGSPTRKATASNNNEN